MLFMKATVDIPGDLYRKVKAKSALLGQSIREVTVELYERWLTGEPPAGPTQSPDAWLRSWLAGARGARGRPCPLDRR
jgi:hypothetical protein